MKKKKTRNKQQNFSECLNLFWIFFKIGSVLFGGGYAILPFLQREFTEKRDWVTDSEITDYFALGQCTPGIIAVNTATFIGYKRQKILGGVWATLGVVTPSLIIITLIASFFSNFSEIKIIADAFFGIRIAVAAIMVNAVIKLYKAGVKDLFGIIIFVASLLAGMFLNISPVIIIFAAGLLGFLIKRRKGAAK